MPNRKIAPLKKEETQAIRHKPFWAVILSIFIISIITIISYIETPILTGNAIVQPVSFLERGSELHIEVKDVKGVKEVTINLLDDVKNGLVRIDEVKPVNFTGTAYSSFVISSTDDKKFGQVRFVLKISEDDLLKEGISKFDIVLYHGGEELPTLRSKTERSYIYYTAISPGIGSFIIGKSQEKFAKEELEEAEPIVEEEIPPEEPEKEVSEAIQKEEVKISLWERFVKFLKRLFQF